MTDTRKLGVENKDACYTCPATSTNYCSFLNGNLAKIMLQWDYKFAGCLKRVRDVFYRDSDKLKMYSE